MDQQLLFPIKQVKDNPETYFHQAPFEVGIQSELLPNISSLRRLRCLHISDKGLPHEMDVYCKNKTLNIEDVKKYICYGESDFISKKHIHAVLQGTGDGLFGTKPLHWPAFDFCLYQVCAMLCRLTPYMLYLIFFRWSIHGVYIISIIYRYRPVMPSEWNHWISWEHTDATIIKHQPFITTASQAESIFSWEDSYLVLWIDYSSH